MEKQNKTKNKNKRYTSVADWRTEFENGCYDPFATTKTT